MMPSAEQKSEDRASHHLTAGLPIVSLLTFLSRILGLVRDIGMAAMFGNSPLMDAFSVAFRIPNLARGMFGEGALTAAFLPAFLRERTERGEQGGWRLTTGVLLFLTIGLSSLVVVCEILLGLIWLGTHAESDFRLLVGLTAALLPYLVLVCLASQLSAVLYALDHFFWPSFEPVLLNLMWIAALWLLAPSIESPTARIYLVSATIVLSGFVQLFAPWPTLKRLGFRLAMDWKGSSDRLLQMLRAMLAIAVGLSVTQLNTLLDGFTAWGFTRPESAANIIPWLPGRLPYPLDPGTASALYFGQRVYQFPLGVFGVALGTVLFPLLSRHAAERRFVELRADLATGLRLVLFISVPASAGLAVMARPLTVLLFEHGSFNSQNVEQTAGAIRMYGSAVWAYCGLLIVNRGFYAVGDRRTPLLMSFFGMLINLGLNLILMWPMAGDGLALATATSSAIQFGIAVWLFQNRVGRLNWTRLGRSVVQITAMTMAMAGLCEFVAELFPPARPLTDRVLSVLAPIAASMALYFGVAWLFGLEEARLLFGSLRLSRRIKKGM